MYCTDTITLNSQLCRPREQLIRKAGSPRKKEIKKNILRTKPRWLLDYTLSLCRKINLKLIKIVFYALTSMLDRLLSTSLGDLLARAILQKVRDQLYKTCVNAAYGNI